MLIKQVYQIISIIPNIIEYLKDNIKMEGRKVMLMVDAS